MLNDLYEIDFDTFDSMYMLHPKNLKRKRGYEYSPWTWSVVG